MYYSFKILLALFCRLFLTDLHRDTLLPQPGDLREQAVQQQVRPVGHGLRPVRDGHAEARLQGGQHEEPGAEDPARLLPGSASKSSIRIASEGS